MSAEMDKLGEDRKRFSALAGGDGSAAPSTSIGAKLIIVLITGAISLLPLFAVNGVLALRDSYASGVIRNLESGLGGRQRAFGPVIAVPTRWLGLAPDLSRETDDAAPNVAPPPVIFFTPDQLSVSAELSARRFEESLYSVIGYDADVSVQAEYPSLDASKPFINRPDDRELEYLWDEAVLVLYLTDTASTQYRPELKTDMGRVALSPGLSSVHDVVGLQSALGIRTRAVGGAKMQGYSAGIGRLFAPDLPFKVETQLAFKGATSFTVAPVGAETSIAFSSNQAPSKVRDFSADYDAVYQPGEGETFENLWTAAGPYRIGPADVFRREANSSLLSKQDFAVEFDAQNIRPYEDIFRALRYGYFLMAFSFLTFFVFDAVSSRYLHAAQYFLLGLIQTVFYALLLGVSEFTGFDRGFILSAAPTVAVTGIAIARILGSVVMGVVALLIFAAFYSVQYVLMDMAQYSLLVAAGAAFVAISAALIVTSRLEWGRFTDKAS